MSKKNIPSTPKGISETKIKHVIGGRTNPKPAQPTFQKPPPSKKD